MVCHRILASQDNNSPDPGTFTDKGGYYQFPNGLIFQWGKNEHEGWSTIIFPKPFPNKCLSFNASSNVPDDVVPGDYRWAPKLGTITNSYAHYYVNGLSSYWMAIGY